ncbi:SLBB domain-containing protein [Brucepastera parasyntrophica]|uniref:SLBB domain-containing protein n=1 Tax=Brucepastera parasyntrophica TaxID=2880008 RepID=UPI00210A9FFE|nr:SLBB domain-containing protein [Brucepastera parasyntrophica]ULQ60025.1 SLBB domain-containing protein [Brucepastera parasyntrophica]
MTQTIQFRKSREMITYEALNAVITGNAFLPSISLVPLLQHRGSPANPLVAPGEQVREGQLIARGSSSDSAHIHSPIPGIIQKFKTVPQPDGSMGVVAVIRLSGAFDILGKKQEQNNWRYSSEREITGILEDKGVICTFEHPDPLVPLIRAAKKKGRPVLVVRLFDLDPTCQTDSMLAEQYFSIILEGAAIIARALDASAVLFVYSGKEKNQFTISADISSELFHKRKILFRRVEARYPSGNTGCFNEIYGAAFPDGKTGSTLFIDPVTAISVWEAVVQNKPILYRYISVSGHALKKPAFLKVRIGTPIGDVIEECGGFKADPARIIVNGLLTGTSVYDLDTPVTKYTKSLHIMDNESCPSYSVNNCIHCGRCVQVCPVSIDPYKTVANIRKGIFSPKTISDIRTCQNCGCCVIVCPSRIPMHHIISEAESRMQKGEYK